MIDHYSFGRISINGNQFTSDVIIFPDGRVQGTWWRREGHSLSSFDIQELIASGPEIIIAGTGASGLMRPQKELIDLLVQEGIRFVAQPSQKASEIYNELKQSNKVGACFHLTC